MDLQRKLNKMLLRNFDYSLEDDDEEEEKPKEIV
jgi:hypothetical protein